MSMTAAVRAAPAPGGERIRIVDTNVNLFHWPFRRLPLDGTAELLEKMEQLGVESAWAGSFDGLLHRDVGAVNERLAKECERSRQRLRAFGSVNPTLPDWEEDLRRCHEVYRMSGIRLHPNYHGYTLANPVFERVVTLASERRLIIQLAVSMEDVRTQHPLMLVRDVDLAPLAAVLKRHTRGRVVLLNAGRGSAAAFKSLANVPGAYFDISRVEGSGGVAAFLKTVPESRVLFGTHAPFFIYEASLMKVFESELSEAAATRLLHANASDLLRPG